MMMKIQKSKHGRGITKKPNLLPSSVFQHLSRLMVVAIAALKPIPAIIIKKDLGSNDCLILYGYLAGGLLKPAPLLPQGFFVSTASAGLSFGHFSGNHRLVGLPEY